MKKVLLLFLLSTATASFVQAQDSTKVQQKIDRKEMATKWKNATPEERAKLKQEWKNVSPEQKAKIKAEADSERQNRKPAFMRKRASHKAFSDKQKAGIKAKAQAAKAEIPQ